MTDDKLLRHYKELVEEYRIRYMNVRGQLNCLGLENEKLRKEIERLKEMPRD